MSSERPQRQEQPEVDISEFAKVLETDVGIVRTKWNRLHKIYVTLHMFLVFVALVLSGGVIPYAAFYSMNAIAFVSGLVVALMIGIQNAFAVGGRWAFYSDVLAELQALTFELRRCMSNSSIPPEERLKQLEGISDRLAQINTRALIQVPRGQGMAVVEESRSTQRPAANN